MLPAPALNPPEMHEVSNICCFSCRFTKLNSAQHNQIEMCNFCKTNSVDLDGAAFCVEVVTGMSCRRRVQQ
jgi:hypothetical protein